MACLGVALISCPGKASRILLPTVSKHIHHLILIKYAGGNHKLTVRVTGNLLDDGTHTYAYDSQTQLIQRDSTSYGYDASGTLLLEAVRDIQQARFGEIVADELQADRKIAGAEPAGVRQAGQAGEVHRDRVDV